MDSFSTHRRHAGSLTRRRFVLQGAVAGSILAASRWSQTAEKSQFQTVRRAAQALGSSVAMTALHPDQTTGELALDAAFHELEVVENVMSLYRPESQLCELNRRGVLANPHPYLVTVLEHAAEVARQTEGAFDVTVQPLWELFHEADQRGGLPDEHAVREARERVDWRQVEISQDRIRLLGARTAVTLNGIAQGFAADMAMDALRRRGVVHGLIDTGEVGALGSKPPGQRWKVGIQHPRQPDAYISLAHLKDRCLATSGDYETRFGPGFAHHHLFDPRTGYSPSELASVSVVAPTAMEADALSTALFVMGPERGMDFLRGRSGADAFLVLKEGRTLASPNFPSES